MAEERKDPRFRPFRALSWGVYLFVTVGFCFVIIYNVLSSAATMTPRRVGEAKEQRAEVECRSGLMTLFADMDSQRQALAAARPVRSVDLQWTKFRLPWLEQLRDLESHCTKAQGASPELAKAFVRLDKLMDLYTTHAVQFAGEVGPTLDAYVSAVGAPDASASAK